MLKKIVFFLPALLLFVPLLTPVEKTTVFPLHGKSACRMVPYVDYRDTTGGSLGNLKESSEKLVYSYTLEPVNHSLSIKPVSGIEIDFSGDTLDASRYNYLVVSISMKKDSSFVTSIVTGERLSDTALLPDCRYSERMVSLQPNHTSYYLPLKEFKAPRWWKAFIGYDRFFALPNKNPDLSKVTAIRLQNNPGGPLHVPERMEIQGIEFRKRRGVFSIILPAVGVLWLLIAISLTCRSYIRKKKEREIKESIVPVVLPDTEEDQQQRIADFIGANYQIAELTIGNVAKATGVSESLISVLLQRKFQLNFKQYLNYVRINQALSLLKETHQSISVIAFAVGYNSIPHFNRVFRELENVTPTRYREQNKVVSA